MASQVFEGIWEEIIAHNGAQLAGRQVKIYVDIEENTLDAAISRWSNRTSEEILESRQRILKATPEPQPLPPGKTLADVLLNQWPGNETDEEINAALEKLS